MSSFSVHDEWLSLIEISGPFLAVPVLKEVFPQGLEELDALKRKRLRQAYDEWREAQETDDPQFLELHAAWINEVLSRGLELDESGVGDTLKRGDQVPASLRVTLPEHGVTLAPDLAVVDTSQGDNPLMLIHTYAADVDLEGSIKQDGWAASPAERMVQLCRMTGCRIGLITNGERWMLVDAPVGAVTTFASWYARIWSQEPITLQAFVHLLGIRRFFIDKSEQLPALFDRSLKYQDEVTEALGEQVRRAVEVLIQSLDKADQDRNRELLRDVAPTELYEAGLTVMMRLVFLLSAEERGLLLMGDESYEANYALSTLRMQLRAESEEILERRWDAWSRLLAIFRAVFGGIEHENLRLPALGGSLFDPDRFTFLEGRAKGSKWRTDIAKPLPIDNRTVLLLLEAIQQFQGRTLSYRALDVEQIGYVYEGLLERTVKRTDEVTLELDATRSAKTPWVKLGELDSAKLDGSDRLTELLIERLGSSTSRVRNDLAKPVDDKLADHLLAACQGDLALRDRIRPYAHLLRIDTWGYPLVYPKGAFIVTTGSDRRETGTHYTPKSLTEAIVAETLTPIAYVGPAEGKPRDQWVLKRPAELIELKICDPAMGSGAFLVQACRWLSDRLVEAWSQAEEAGNFVTIVGDVSADSTDDVPLPRDAEARNLIARRLIAERCLYGVDLNPLAVELAKLSIWLVTLAKNRPFGFLDHNLRCGDTLLGIHRLDQLTELNMTPGEKGQQRLFGKNIELAVHEAFILRQQLREIPIRDIHDVEAMARLDADSRRRLDVPEKISDAFIGEVFRNGGSGQTLESAIASLVIQAVQAIDGDGGALEAIIARTKSALSVELPAGKKIIRPFHWPLEFPEVFVGDSTGFDAVISNPPYLGGKKISAQQGDKYRAYLAQYVGFGRKGSADLSVYFLLRACAISDKKAIGYLTTNSISDGDNRVVGLDHISQDGFSVISATKDLPWPGKANLSVTILLLFGGQWKGHRFLNGIAAKRITPYLTEEGAVTGNPHRLHANLNIAFQGSLVHGKGFVISTDEAHDLFVDDEKYRDVVIPYLRGEDFLNDPDQKPLKYVINFRDWPYQKASQYPACLKILIDRVKSERDKLVAKGGQIHEYDFWKFWDKRLESYERISKLKQVIFHAFTSKYLAMGFCENSFVFAAPHVVIGLEDYSYWGLLQSTIHEIWVRQYSSKLETRMRYAPSDCFETFPFPVDCSRIFRAAENYHEERKSFMIDNSIGLTATYNQFHDSQNCDSFVVLLRKRHIEVDEAVITAYGWENIKMDHDFRITSQGERFTFSENVRRELLDRLLVLNHQRYEVEVAQGLHGNTATQLPRKTNHEASTKNAAQPGLDFGNAQDKSAQ